MSGKRKEHVLSVRVDDDTLAVLRAWADAQEKSLGRVIREALERGTRGGRAHEHASFHITAAINGEQAAIIAGASR